nr:hypothetical protein [Acinetobacter sp. YH1901136]
MKIISLKKPLQIGLCNKAAIWAKINEGSLAQISGHKPSALVERHYIVRPMDMLRETLQEYEDWILQQVQNGIN